MNVTKELAERIEDLWNDERCVWKVVYESTWGGPGYWNVYLEWTSEYQNPHQAEWVTYSWQFYDEDSLEAPLREAVEWLEQLKPWAPCPECDGNGVWQGVPCADCEASGLLYPSSEVSA